MKSQYHEAIAGVRIEHIGERTVNRECDRCGRSLGDARTITVHCADCASVLKAEQPKSLPYLRRMRKRAAEEGWDYDNPDVDIVLDSAAA